MEEIKSISNDEKNENNALESPNSHESLLVDLGSGVASEKKSGGLFGFFKKKPAVNNLDSLEFESLANESNEIHLTQNEGSISLESSQSGADIFQELELGDLNFGEQKRGVKVKEPLEPIVIVSNTLFIIFWICLIAFLGFFTSVFVRNTDASFIANMPLACDYIGSSIENYDNSGKCETLSQIVTGLTKANDSLEKQLIQDLSLLVPKKLKANYILSSPEVKFIQEKTGNSRISIPKVSQEFEDIRVKSGGYQGKNIECSAMQMNEKGNLDVSCSFFGTSIIEATNQDQMLSSRGVALDFLDKLQSKNSNFTIVDFPTNIEISKFNGTDGIKVIFSTQTSLTLKLKYSPLSTKS